MNIETRNPHHRRSALQVTSQWWAAGKYLRTPTSYRTAFMISSVLSLAAYPVGTAIGLYSLWVVLFLPLKTEQAAQRPGHEVA
jgi:hypothetical protein